MAEFTHNFLCYIFLELAAHQNQGWSTTTATPRIWSMFFPTLLNSTGVTSQTETTATKYHDICLSSTVVWVCIRGSLLSCDNIVWVHIVVALSIETKLNNHVLEKAPTEDKCNKKAMDITRENRNRIIVSSLENAGIVIIRTWLPQLMFALFCWNLGQAAPLRILKIGLRRCICRCNVWGKAFALCKGGQDSILLIKLLDDSVPVQISK